MAGDEGEGTIQGRGGSREQLIFRDSRWALLFPAKGSSACLCSMAQKATRGRRKAQEKHLGWCQGELNSPEHAAAEAGLAIPSLEAETVQDEQPRAEPAARGLGAAHLQWHLVTGSPRWPVRKHRRSPAGDGQGSTRPISLGSQATQPGSSGVAHAAGEGHFKKHKYVDESFLIQPPDTKVAAGHAADELCPRSSALHSLVGMSHFFPFQDFPSSLGALPARSEQGTGSASHRGQVAGGLDKPRSTAYLWYVHFSKSKSCSFL